MSWGMRVARSQLLRAPPPDVRHRPLVETALHRAPAKLHQNVLPAGMLGGVFAHALQHDGSRRHSGGFPATMWLDAATIPRTPIERAVRCIEALVKPPPWCAGCEWWVQHLLPGSRGDIALHWDKDECEAAQRKWITHPALASVFYLSDAGGPTLILPVRVPSPAQGSQQGSNVLRIADSNALLDCDALPDSDAYACFPTENRLLTFQGNLLHGVLDEPWPVGGGRLTLLVNWWEEKPQAPCCDRSSPPESGSQSDSEPYTLGLGGTPTELCATRKCLDDGDAITHCSLQLPGVAGGDRLSLRFPWKAKGGGMGGGGAPAAGSFIKWAFHDGP